MDRPSHNATRRLFPSILPAVGALKPSNMSRASVTRSTKAGALWRVFSPDADFVTGQMLPVNGGLVFN